MKIKISNILKRGHLKDKSQRGATIVEFALILPMLITILFGIFQFGIAFNNWIALTQAASEGARLASVGGFSEQEVKDRAPSVDILSVTATGIGGNIGDPVTVTVVGQVLDIQIPFVGHWPIQLQSTSTMRLETSG